MNGKIIRRNRWGRVGLTGALAALLGVVGIALAQGQGEPNLQLIVEPDSLVLYVAADEPVSLTGLQFGVVNTEGSIQTFTVEERFDALRLTGGIARPGSCYVYERAGTSPILPTVCSLSTRVYSVTVAQADVFWYDDVGHRQRDIAIYASGTSTGQVCSASPVACSIIYLPITPTPISTLTLTPSPTDTPTPEPDFRATAAVRLTQTAVESGTLTQTLSAEEVERTLRAEIATVQAEVTQTAVAALPPVAVYGFDSTDDFECWSIRWDPDVNGFFDGVLALDSTIRRGGDQSLMVQLDLSGRTFHDRRTQIERSREECGSLLPDTEGQFHGFSAWLYLPPEASTTVEAQFFVQPVRDNEWRWDYSPFVRLQPGEWVELTWYPRPDVSAFWYPASEDDPWVSNIFTWGIEIKADSGYQGMVYVDDITVR